MCCTLLSGSFTVVLCMHDSRMIDITDSITKSLRFAFQNLNPRILLTANPFTVNSEQQCFYLFFQFRASLIEISCTSHCRLTVYKRKPYQ